MTTGVAAATSKVEAAGTADRRAAVGGTREARAVRVVVDTADRVASPVRVATAEVVKADTAVRITAGRTTAVMAAARVRAATAKRGAARAAADGEALEGATAAT
jgi:hypothetical protein